MNAEEISEERKREYRRGEKVMDWRYEKGEYKRRDRRIVKERRSERR